MPTTTDLIGLAIDKNPVDFASTFDELLRQKQEAALEARKEEIAKSIYSSNDADDDDDLSDDVDFESDDTDEGDDDLDLDLDDLELDLDELDLDLEDITDDGQDA